jgi:hypothetical protein
MGLLTSPELNLADGRFDFLLFRSPLPLVRELASHRIRRVGRRFRFSASTRNANLSVSVHSSHL